MSVRANKENQPVEETSTIGSRYSRNPDVVLREEDEDGALLFNPDTDRIRVLNATGLYIWKLCDGSHDLTRLVLAMRGAFAEIPEDAVTGHVQAYLDDMVRAGFIGTVEG